MLDSTLASVDRDMSVSVDIYRETTHTKQYLLFNCLNTATAASAVAVTLRTEQAEMAYCCTCQASWHSGFRSSDA